MRYTLAPPTGEAAKIFTHPDSLKENIYGIRPIGRGATSSV